ncbi:zinc ribbon domain-containing protein [Desemzia sp. FAM 23990]|uniref:zinc ribbon domain-containing protein n=1 Tax=Desemzia sp. FAM 23990 TaxID=3259520 RepID=UPI003888CAFD
MCKKCSFTNEDGAKFCENCGHLLGTEPTKEQKLVDVDALKKNVQKVDLAKAKMKLKSLTKIQKIGIILITVVVLLFAGGFAFANNYYTRENQVSRYIEMINTGDAAKIAKAISTEDLNFELTEENMQPYADYINEDKEYIRLLTTRMEDEFAAADSSNEIYLKQEGKDLFFFDHYEMMVNPVYAELSTNMENAVITLNGKEVGIADRSDYTQKIGPLSPGRYAFASNVEQYGIPLMNEQEVFFSGGNDTNYVDLSLSGVNIEVTSNIPDAQVYLNDKEIGQLKDGEGSFGPISWQEDSYLSVEKEFATEVLESYQLELENYDEYYSFTFDILDEYGAQELIDMIYQMTDNLTYYGNDFDDTFRKQLAESMVDGEENTMYQTLFNNAQKTYDDETISSVNYSAEVKGLKQIDAYEYEVTYDLRVDTQYSYDSDKEDFLETIPFKANVVLVESETYEDEYDALLKSVEAQ